MQISGLVSTIIPVHNRAKMVAEAVESVLAQDYRPIEIIVVDDGSTDETREVVTRLAAGRKEIRACRRENGGPGAARETGRLLARGEFIQYLDSDDLLLPGKFRSQVSALHANPDCDVSYGVTRFRRVDGAAVDGPWKGSGERVETMFPSFLVSRWWDTPNPIYRRAVCDRAGPWMATRIEEDWEYDCRIASLGGRLAYVPQFVCEVRDHAFDRLSRGGNESARLKDRARAHQRIYAHARNAKIEKECAEMRRFARALFLLARQCGAAGLAGEAQSLFSLAREASVERRGNGWDFKLYRLAAMTLGWTRAGKIACQLDRFRP